MQDSSMRPSLSLLVVSFAMVLAIILSSANRSEIALSEPKPRALKSTVEQILRFLST